MGTISGAVLLMLLGVSSVTDLSRRKIYNWTTYCAVAWAFAINFVHRFDAVPQLGAIGLRQSLLGFMGCFIVMLFVYSLARGGAGDVKLAAAIGALVGFEAGVLVIATSYVIAGAAILLWSIWARGPISLLLAMGRFMGSAVFPRWILPPDRTDKLLLRKQIPLAPFFAVGTLAVVGGLV